MVAKFSNVLVSNTSHILYLINLVQNLKITSLKPLFRLFFFCIFLLPQSYPEIEIGKYHNSTKVFLQGI